MLPLNSGENNSMNPGEQNQNNFGQPGPVMSSANDTTASSPTPSPVSSGQPSSSTSRFFGGASRYKGPKTRSASTPEYFSQPAPTPGPIAMSAPLPEYKERKSKTPIFIGIGAVALIAIIVVAVVALVPAMTGTSTNKEETVVDIQNSMKEYGEALAFYDREITEEFRLSADINNKEYYSEYKKQLNEYLPQIRTMKEDLEKYKKTGAITKRGSDQEINLDETVDVLKKLINERMGAYEKLHNIMVPYADIYINNGSADSIKAFEDAVNSEEAKSVAKVLSAHYKAQKERDSACNKTSSSSQKCEEATKNFIKSKNNVTSNKSMQKIGESIRGQLDLKARATTYVDIIKNAELKGDKK